MTGIDVSIFHSLSFVDFVKIRVLFVIQGTIILYNFYVRENLFLKIQTKDNKYAICSIREKMYVNLGHNNTFKTST